MPERKARARADPLIHYAIVTVLFSAADEDSDDAPFPSLNLLDSYVTLSTPAGIISLELRSGEIKLPRH
jgi:hypothetical protein